MEISAETVRWLYWLQERSLAEVAQFVGIPRRNRTWRMAGWNRGRRLPVKQRKLMSQRRKEMFASGELIHWNLGRHWGAETRSKISASLLQGRQPAPSYYGPDWRQQRTACLQRDEATCQQCGSQENIEVHHWEPYRFSFDNSLDNLVTLCAECHTEMHVRYRCEGFTAQAELEFYGA